MNKIVLDEKKVAKDILEKGWYDSRNVTTYKAITIMIKYYYLQGITDKTKLKYTILELFKNIEECFIMSEWSETVEKAIDVFFKQVKFRKIEPKLIKVEELKIYSKELEFLDNVEYVQDRKILFACLIYAKIFNQLKQRNSGWFEVTTFSDILKLAKCKTGNEAYRIDIQSDLRNKGYIKTMYKKGKCKIGINFINETETEDNKVVMTISDFDNAIYQYLMYLGENWKQCECEGCNKWFKQKSKKPQKYCVFCAKEKQKELQRKCMQNLRNKS